MFVVYNFVLTILAPLWVPWMMYRASRRKEKVNWSERQGMYRIPAKGKRRRLWFHAVSVGEVIAIIPVLRIVRERLPDHEVILTVTTSSGHETATERAAGLYKHLLYFPMDIPLFQLRAMQIVRPEVAIIAETELWMNFLWAAKTFDVRTVLLNGRISDRSFPRARNFRFFYRSLLRQVDRCLMQSETDAERIRALGANSAEVLGNCKFDQAAERKSAPARDWRKELQLDDSDFVVVVGSLRAEEAEFVVPALLAHSDVRWIVAPRHLDRADEILSTWRGAGAPAFGRRSESSTASYLLLDTYGELDRVYAIADIAIIGGGFAKLGGQNVIQPLAHGKPVIFGPHMANFRDVASMALANSAALSAATPTELSEAISTLRADAALRARMGDAATNLVAANVGASRRYVDAIVEEIHLSK